MSEEAPARRPALKKAKDSDVHPTLATPDDAKNLHRRRGASTSDTLRDPRGEKLVPVEVQIPKKLRKHLRSEAKKRGMSLSELVTALLQPPSGR
jgi:hypothetical protein